MSFERSNEEQCQSSICPHAGNAFGGKKKLNDRAFFNSDFADVTIKAADLLSLCYIEFPLCKHDVSNDDVFYVNVSIL